MTHKGLCDQVPDLALAPLLLNVCPSSTKLLVFLIHWYSHLHRPLFLISSRLCLSHTHSFISTHLLPGSLPWNPKRFVFTLDPEFPMGWECVLYPYEPPFTLAYQIDQSIQTKNNQGLFSLGIKWDFVQRCSGNSDQGVL